MCIRSDLSKLNLYDHNYIAFSRLVDELEAPLFYDLHARIASGITP